MTTSAAPVPPPDYRRLGTTFEFAWPAIGLAFEASRLREHSDNLSCEIHITYQSATVDVFRLSLLSARERSAAANHLERRTPGVEWIDYITALCVILLREYRREDPAQDLALGDPPLITTLVHPTLKRGGLGVLFGDFGKGKTLIAYGHAIVTAYPAISLTNLEAHDHGPVMIIDYEMGMDQAKATVRALLAGFNLPPEPDRIYIRHLVHPLSDSAESLRKEIAKLGIVLTIVDSQSQAAPQNGQGDPAGPVRELVRTLNTFETTNLLISQISKVESRYEGTREPYGSRHLSYLADDTWEVRGIRDPDTRALTTTLYHRKHRGAWSPPLAFAATFPQSGVIQLAETLAPADDTQSDKSARSAKAKRTGRRSQAIGAVVALGEATASQVGVRLGITKPDELDSLRTDLRWLAREQWIRVIRPGGRGGRGNETVYGPAIDETQSRS
jgi:hypothetical protein